MAGTMVLPFKGTKEQETKLREIISKYKDVRGALIPVLHEAQGIYGYLPIEVQTIIAEELDISLSDIYGVVTFYTQFSLTPKGKYHVAVCLGTACYVKGSGQILDKIKEKLNLETGVCSKDGKFYIEATRCIGACGLAPVFTVNEEVYGRVKLSEVDKIVDKYIND